MQKFPTGSAASSSHSERGLSHFRIFFQRPVWFLKVCEPGKPQRKSVSQILCGQSQGAAYWGGTPPGRPQAALLLVPKHEACTSARGMTQLPTGRKEDLGPVGGVPSAPGLGPEGAHCQQIYLVINSLP